MRKFALPLLGVVAGLVALEISLRFSDELSEINGNLDDLLFVLSDLTVGMALFSLWRAARSTRPESTPN